MTPLKPLSFTLVILKVECNIVITLSPKSLGLGLAYQSFLGPSPQRFIITSSLEPTPRLKAELWPWLHPQGKWSSFGLPPPSARLKVERWPFLHPKENGRAMALSPSPRLRAKLWPCPHPPRLKVELWPCPPPRVKG